MQLTFRSMCETAPGEAWQRVVSHGWPGWQEWFTQRTSAPIPLTKMRHAVRRAMPEFENLWDTLCNTVDADDDLVHFLSFWCPPRYLVNCSQVVAIDDQGPFLIRNYDLDPALNEATFLSTKWSGTRVAGMVEALSGLADGMNEFGLTASLTFGGRVETAKGFGIPVIIRYLLQTCRDVADGIEVLRTVPSHMSYNVSLIDAAGTWATVYVAPDRPAIVRRQAWATNHQLGVEWPMHGRVSNTLERAKHLEAVLKGPQNSAADLLRVFNQSPVFSTNYRRGFGTVYTATYRPIQRTARLSWRDGTRLEWNIHAVTARKQAIAYSVSGSRALASSHYTPNRPEPGWYSAFLSDTHSKASGPDQDRLAAFWRRSHLGQDQDWANLSIDLIPPPKETR
jgi:predicted choloylglycine hydrolase